MRNRDNNGVATILANLQADLHLLKEKVASHATSGDNKDDPIIQESLRHLQATQGCLRASQNTILKSSLPIVLPDEFSSAKTAFLERLLREAGMDRSGGDAVSDRHNGRLADELALLKKEVASLKKQQQIYADTAIQFQSQYNQLLDQLEEVGVHVSIPGAPAATTLVPNGAGSGAGSDPLTSPQFHHTFGDSGGTSQRPIIQGEESKLYEYSTTQSAMVSAHGSPRVVPRHGPEKGDDFYESSDEESDMDSEMESVAPSELPQMTEEDAAAIQMSDSLRSAQEELPLLEGFLEKKSPSFGRGWQRRFVVVKGYNIFYNRGRVSVSSEVEIIASKKFLNGISLMVVDSIREIEDKSGRISKKFQIKARDPRTGDMRAYIWRASTVEERDRWVEGLNQHLDLLQSIFRWAALNKNEHTRVDLHMSQI